MTQLPLFYENTIVWTGEKRGEVSGPKLPSLEVATPPDFGGHEGLWSPEQCFVAAVNACVMSTFLAIAQLSKLSFESYQAEASGKLDKPEGQVMQFTEITIRAKLIVTHSKDLERAGRLLEKAEKQCLVSNSIKTVVHLEPQITAASD